jgi:heme exporter protein D
MMVDLGKYAVEVLSAYAVSLLLLALLVALTLWRGRRVRAMLNEMERKGRSDG